MKLFIQLLDVPILIPFARTLSGKTSETSTQLDGPQDQPKLMAKSQTNTMDTHPAAGCCNQLSSKRPTRIAIMM